MHAEADTEEWSVGEDVFFDDVYEVMFMKSSDGIAEGANARENDTGGVGELFG